MNNSKILLDIACQGWWLTKKVLILLGFEPTIQRALITHSTHLFLIWRQKLIRLQQKVFIIWLFKNLFFISDHPNVHIYSLFKVLLCAHNGFVWAIFAHVFYCFRFCYCFTSLLCQFVQLALLAAVLASLTWVGGRFQVKFTSSSKHFVCAVLCFIGNCIIISVFTSFSLGYATKSPM